MIGLLKSKSVNLLIEHKDSFHVHVLLHVRIKNLPYTNIINFIRNINRE